MMNLVPTESSKCYKVERSETWEDKTYTVRVGYIEQYEDEEFQLYSEGESLNACEVKWLGDQLVYLNSKV
jgi:hypothetical protein